MSSFEERFPEFKKIKCCCWNCIEAYEVCPKGSHVAIHVTDIKKYCLSKQRVKEVLNNWLMDDHNLHCGENEKLCNRCMILIELGLEEEE